MARHATRSRWLLRRVDWFSAALAGAALWLPGCAPQEPETPAEPPAFSANAFEAWPEGPDLRATQAGLTHVAVRWNPPEFQVKGYEVQVDGRRWAQTTGPSAALTGLSPGTAYEVQVVATAYNGNVSQPSEVMQIQTRGAAGVPAAPSRARAAP